ncbi:MAG: hypothetical protein ACOC3T_00015 [Bacteroidota bacterium]
MQDKVTSTDKLLYTYIRSFTRNDKPVFASNKHLASIIGKSESVISHSISRLLKHGYLENRGNKYARQLYTKSDLVNADFSIGKAENDKGIAENSISLEEMKRVIAENSNKETLKTAIANAENSYILIKILLSYIDKNNNSMNSKIKKPENVTQQVWDDFCKHRKTKKAPVTQTAIDRIKSQADKVNWTLEDALAEIVARNWQGFKAEWVESKKPVDNYNPFDGIARLREAKC